MWRLLQGHTVRQLTIIKKIRNFTKRICHGIWNRYLIAHTVSLLPDFFFGKPDETTQIYDSNTYVKEYTYLGIIGEEKEGTYRIEQRNKFSVGETIEVMKPNGENVEVTVKRILTEDGEERESARQPETGVVCGFGNQSGCI